MIGNGTAPAVVQLLVADQIRDAATVTVNANATLNLNNNAETVAAIRGAGSIALGTATLTVNGNTTDTFDGVISGGGNFSRMNAGSGTGVTVFTAKQTYGGFTNIQNTNSTIRITVDDALPTTTSLLFNGTTATNTRLDLNGRNQTVASLDSKTTTGSVFVENNSGGGTSVLTIANGNPAHAFGGKLTTGTSAIRDNNGVATGGKVAVAVTGGTVVVAGANTYSGGSTVSAGTLVLAGSGNLGTGAVTVNGTGTLGGTASIAGPLTVGGSGVIAPATVTTTTNPGRLTFTNAVGVTFNGGSLAIDVAGTTPATGHDQLALTAGPLSLGAGVTTLALSAAGYTPTPDDVYWIVNNSSSAPTTGFFAGLPDGSTVDLGGVAFTIRYGGLSGTTTFNGGNDVALVGANVVESVPEPTSAAAIGLAALGLLARRRRSRGLDRSRPEWPVRRL